MVQLEWRPSECAVRAVSIHCSPVILWSQMMRRTRSQKISAPPPGSESMPASRSRTSTSRTDIFARCARYATSTMVKAFRCTCGNRSFSPRSISQYQSSVSSGCSRRVDGAVHVEVSSRAVQSLAHQVRHVTDGENVGGPVKRHAIVIGETLACFDFFQNRPQARVVNYDFHRTSAAQNTKNSMRT